MLFTIGFARHRNVDGLLYIKGIVVKPEHKVFLKSKKTVKKIQKVLRF